MSRRICGLKIRLLRDDQSLPQEAKSISPKSAQLLGDMNAEAEIESLDVQADGDGADRPSLVIRYCDACLRLQRLGRFVLFDLIDEDHVLAGAEGSWELARLLRQQCVASPFGVERGALLGSGPGKA
ncbi:hypothetical protein GGE20_000742 [Rhizobium leguminosarum]|nr:hypothetical protein [Rhizobium leguminosarum]